MAYTTYWTDDENQEWEIEYNYVGKYFPATPTEPAEHPSLEIDSITQVKSGIRMLPNEEIEDYVNDNHESDEEGDFFGN